METLTLCPTLVRVNEEGCLAFTPRVRQLVAGYVPSDPFALAHLPPREQSLALLHLVGICERINWDFLFSTVAVNLWAITEGFAERRLAKVSVSEFATTFAGYRRSGEELDCARRLVNLRTLAEHIEHHDILKHLLAVPTVAGAGGAVHLLRTLPIYGDDPLMKKTYALLQQFVRRELICVADEDAIEPAVDYHLLRLYLRTHRVVVTDVKLSAHLITRTPVPPEVITQLRRAVAEAIRFTARAAGISVLALNEAEWAFAREACERDVVACKVPFGCPFRNLCPSGGLEPKRMLTEPESWQGYY